MTKVIRKFRMQPVGDCSRIEASAALIATLAKRKQLNRWKLTKRAVRELSGPLRGTKFQQLSDCLAEYGIQLMDLDDKHYGFLYTEKTKSWTRIGLGDLTMEELTRPDIDKLEDEIGYAGCDLEEEDDE